MLHQATALTGEEAEVLVKIDEARRNLSYAVSQSRRWVGLLRRNTYARAIRGSNSIEGYNVTVDDALAAAEGDQPFDANAQTWAAITGYQNAMTYALQLAEDPHFKYEEALLRSLHFMMMQHDLTKNPGRWRPGPIFVRNDDRDEIVHEGPAAELVSPLMGELVAWLEDHDTSSPIMIVAAMAHLNLVMIHPFSDGNGRMARCLQTLILARERILHPMLCSIEEYLGRNTPAYYAVLADVGKGSWQPENDARPWIRFSLTAHYRQAMTLNRRLKHWSRVWEEVERHVMHRTLPERSMQELVNAAMGYRVRNSTYRLAAEVSDNVATRDLKVLVDQRLLISKGERRGRWYEAAPLLTAIRERFRESGPIEDPFTSIGQQRPTCAREE